MTKRRKTIRNNRTSRLKKIYRSSKLSRNIKRKNKYKGGSTNFLDGLSEELVIITLLNPDISFKKILEMKSLNRATRDAVNKLLSKPELLKLKLATIKEEELVELYTKNGPYQEIIDEVIKNKMNKDTQKIQVYRNTPMAAVGVELDIFETTVDDSWIDLQRSQKTQTKYIKKICSNPNGGIFKSGDFIWVWGNKIKTNNLGYNKSIESEKIVSAITVGKEYGDKVHDFLESLREMEFMAKLSAKMIGIPLIVRHNKNDPNFVVIRIVNSDNSAYYI